MSWGKYFFSGIHTIPGPLSIMQNSIEFTPNPFSLSEIHGLFFLYSTFLASLCRLDKLFIGKSKLMLRRITHLGHKVSSLFTGTTNTSAANAMLASESPEPAIYTRLASGSSESTPNNQPALRTAKSVVKHVPSASQSTTVIAAALPPQKNAKTPRQLGDEILMNAELEICRLIDDYYLVPDKSISKEQENRNAIISKRGFSKVIGLGLLRALQHYKMIINPTDQDRFTIADVTLKIVTCYLWMRNLATQNEQGLIDSFIHSHIQQAYATLESIPSIKTGHIDIKASMEELIQKQLCEVDALQESADRILWQCEESIHLPADFPLALSGLEQERDQTYEASLNTEVMQRNFACR
jgi:hypothetical protein